MKNTPKYTGQFEILENLQRFKRFYLLCKHIYFPKQTNQAPAAVASSQLPVMLVEIYISL